MRMTFDVPRSLHRRVKVACALEGVTIREKVLELRTVGKGQQQVYKLSPWHNPITTLNTC